jgi:hypothetical protein
MQRARHGSSRWQLKAMRRNNGSRPSKIFGAFGVSIAENGIYGVFYSAFVRYILCGLRIKFPKNEKFPT